MRQIRLLSVAVVGIFLLASSAISMAGDWDWSSPTESGSKAMSPDQGNYESGGTLEAGKLPSSENTMSSGIESGSDKSVQTVEGGGAEFRVGIDTGP